MQTKQTKLSDRVGYILQLAVYLFSTYPVVIAIGSVILKIDVTYYVMMDIFPQSLVGRWDVYLFLFAVRLIGLTLCFFELLRVIPLFIIFLIAALLLLDNMLKLIRLDTQIRSVIKLADLGHILFQMIEPMTQPICLGMMGIAMLIDVIANYTALSMFAIIHVGMYTLAVTLTVLMPILVANILPHGCRLFEETKDILFRWQ